MIYLDYAATTPVRQEVIEVITHALMHQFGNPSSVYQLGKQAKQHLENARKSVRQLIDTHDGQIYFTSGATEANNWAIRSQAYRARELGYGNHIVCSAIEHPSVMAVCNALELEGFSVSYVYPDAQGDITLGNFIAATTSQTTGWIAMSVNNETGSQLPIDSLGQEAHIRQLWFHVDAVQSIGKIPTTKWYTSLTSSGHKLYAPKGIGVLAYRAWDSSMSLQPLLFGGGQEQKKRSGTENIPYIMGFAKALELITYEQERNLDHWQKLSEYLYQQLDEADIAYERNGTHQVPYIHSIWLKGQLASQVLIQMDLATISVSAGSACSAGSVIDSAILKAYYPAQEERWRESIRLSFGINTTSQDIYQFVQILKQLLERKVNLWHSHNKQN